MSAGEDIRRIAAEYVIGTLDAGERAALRARTAEEPETAALVALWERRFFPLQELSAPARPPDGLLDLILSRLPEVPAPEPIVPVAPAVPPEPEVILQVSPATEPTPVVVEMVLYPEAPAELGTAPAPADEAPVEPVPAASAPVDAPAAERVPDAGDAQKAEPASQAAEDVTAGEAAAPSKVEPEAPAPEVAATEREVTPPPVAPIAPHANPANPWRFASGLLMLALLLGGGAFTYRELHHRALPPVPPPVKEAEVVPPPPVAPPPAEPVQAGPESFAVLGPQPVPALGLAFDHKTGTVSVLKMAVRPADGRDYHLWFVSEMGDTHHVAEFDAPGTYDAAFLQDMDAGSLSGGLLVVTEEDRGATPPAPTGAPVFSGMAVKR